MFTKVFWPAALAMLAATASPISASESFGTRDAAVALVDEMVAIIADGGVDAGIVAMHDPDLPFATSVMGVHIFEQAIIVADNREPELIATSYAEVQDLTGEPMWPRIVAAADAEGDATLLWYHYDTEEVYEYSCPSKWAVAGDVIVMVCR